MNEGIAAHLEIISQETNIVKVSFFRNLHALQSVENGYLGTRSENKCAVI